MSTSPNLEECLAEAKQAAILRAQQTSSPIPPITIPLSLLVTEPHPVLIELQATHGGVPVPVSAAHFAACIELARSIENACPGVHPAPVSPTKPELDSRLSRASPPPRSGPPRRIVPLSDPPSHAKRFSSPMTLGKAKTPVSTLEKMPPPPKDPRKLAKTACEIAAKFMEEVYASTKANPSSPSAQPDQVAQQELRNADLEDEVRDLRSRVAAIEEEQGQTADRVTELEDTGERTWEITALLKESCSALSGMYRDASDRLETLTGLEAQLASLESGLTTHKTTFDQFQAQVELQLSANRRCNDIISNNVGELYREINDDDGNNLVQKLAKLNEGFEAKMKDWVEWKESLSRRVSKLEQCDEDDDWVDADVKHPIDAEPKH